MLSSVNNDSLAELLIAGILFLLVIAISKAGSEQGGGVKRANEPEAGWKSRRMVKRPQ